MARSNFMNMVRDGFATGLGVMASFIVYIFFGMLFFIPGFILYVKEKKKGRNNTPLQIMGVILMLLGVILMGGLGFSTVFRDISDMV